MPDITLQQKGKIVPPSYVSLEEKERIKNMRAIDYIIERVKKAVNSPYKKISDRCLILKAGTGSGKSSTLPSELYLRIFSMEQNARKIMLDIQPRVLTTVEAAKTILKIPQYSSVVKVGWNTLNYKQWPSSKPYILFCTTGILRNYLTMFSAEKMCESFSCIIIDECHETSQDNAQNISMAKLLLHSLIGVNGCPFIILTSGTIVPAKFANYMESGDESIIEVIGNNYPIMPFYSDIPCGDYIINIIETIKTINTQGSGDVIVFFYGKEPITKIKSLLNNLNKTLDNDKLLLPIVLTSETVSMYGEDMRNKGRPNDMIKIHKDGKTYHPYRRIYLATNVAETGITIPNLTYCIDTGYVNMKEYDPTTNTSIIIPKPVSADMALQRKGRAGRLSAGKWYPLYSEAILTKYMNQSQTPDIIRSDISILLLTLIIKYCIPNWNSDNIIVDSKDMKTFHISMIDMLDLPSLDGILMGLEKLYVLGLINENCQPTIIGLMASKFMRLSIEQIRMLIAALHYDVDVLHIITIIAMTDVKISKTKGDINIKAICDVNNMPIMDDFIDKALVFDKMIEVICDEKQDIDNWISKNGLDLDALTDAIIRRDEIMNECINMGHLDIFDKSTGNSLIFYIKNNMRDYIKRIKRCIYDGYIYNMAKYDSLSMNYRVITTGIALSNIKSMHITSKPLYIVTNDVIIQQDDKHYDYYASMCSVMDKFVDVDETFAIS